MAKRKRRGGSRKGKIPPQFRKSVRGVKLAHQHCGPLLAVQMLTSRKTPKGIRHHVPNALKAAAKKHCGASTHKKGWHMWFKRGSK